MNYMVDLDDNEINYRTYDDSKPASRVLGTSSPRPEENLRSMTSMADTTYYDDNKPSNRAYGTSSPRPEEILCSMTSMADTIYDDNKPTSRASFRDLITQTRRNPVFHD